jgi:cysteine desulfurase
MSLTLPIYMDNNATTKLDPRVLDAMLPYLTEMYGNAASRNHSFGWVAEEAVEQAKEEIADLIGSSAKEIVITSGATESDNLAIKGVAEMYHEKGNHIITSSIEHKAVIDTCKYLEKHGCEVTYLNPKEDGETTAEMVRAAIKENTILVSIMMANNEIGTVNNIKAIGEVCREKNILLHTDATQGVGKIPVNVDDMNIDLMSFSGHKIYGPKGVGALYVRRKNPRVRISALQHGGGHERGMRSGTLNVPGIVGLGKACKFSKEEMDSEIKRLVELREYFIEKVMADLDYTYLNGHAKNRLPGNVNLSFAYVEGESLLMALKNIALSSGSACTSKSLEPSYVIKALGVSEELAHSSLRFGFGRFTKKEEVDYVVEELIKHVKRLRDMSPLYEMVQEGIDLGKVTWQAH